MQKRPKLLTFRAVSDKYHGYQIMIDSDGDYYLEDPEGMSCYGKGIKAKKRVELDLALAVSAYMRGVKNERKRVARLKAKHYWDWC